MFKEKAYRKENNNNNNNKSVLWMYVERETTQNFQFEPALSEESFFILVKTQGIEESAVAANFLAAFF
jgi:hypothetical protein